MRISLEVVDINSNGVVLYEGPSLLNGRPVVVIATGLKRRSKNTKTGGFIQTYILGQEEEPTAALKSGNDQSICGSCIHRRVDGWGTCYVNVGQGPLQVYRAWKRGVYPHFSPEMLEDYFCGSIIRLGAYGDPAAVPTSVWAQICTVARGWTGYTHQWRRRRRIPACDQELRHYCHASVETPHEQRLARAKRWKTFRVRNDDEPLEEHEFICPASAEAGKRLQCEDCLACHGGEWNGRTVTPVIRAHGMSWKPIRFRKMQRLMRQKKRFRTLLPSLIGKGATKGKGTGVPS